MNSSHIVTHYVKYSLWGPSLGYAHTQELWYSLRGIDAGLQSVLSADKCPCDACCARVSKYYFAPEYWQKQTPNFSAKLKIFRRKDPCRKKFLSIFITHALRSRDACRNRRGTRTACPLVVVVVVVVIIIILIMITGYK